MGSTAYSCCRPNLVPCSIFSVSLLFYTCGHSVIFLSICGFPIVADLNVGEVVQSVHPVAFVLHEGSIPDLMWGLPMVFQAQTLSSQDRI